MTSTNRALAVVVVVAPATADLVTAVPAQVAGRARLAHVLRSE